MSFDVTELYDIDAKLCIQRTALLYMGVLIYHIMEYSFKKGRDQKIIEAQKNDGAKHRLQNFCDFSSKTMIETLFEVKIHNCIIFS